MEVLAREARARRRATQAALVVTGLLGAGCLVMEQLGIESKELAFSHRLHVEDEGLECWVCHPTWEEEDDPGMPTAEACALCHEGIDEEKPPERQAASLFDEEGFRATNANDIGGGDVIFSHNFHVTDEEGCAVCHADIIASDAVEPWMGMDMDACVACHAEVGATNECSTCHEDVAVDSAPWTHDAMWDTHHGLSVRNRSTATVDRCDMCHKDSTCVECHTENPPQSHNNFFRRRGHAQQAALDRQTCMACHQPDFCNRCHESAVPVSHRGPWGSPRNTHCYSCHLDETDQGCALCHQATPSHDMAPPLPPGHEQMSDCRECHQLLSHVDNGTSCLVCHQ